MNKLYAIFIAMIVSSCTSVQIQETLSDIQSKSSELLHEQGIVVRNDPLKAFDVTPYRTNTPDKQASSISISLNNSVFSNPEANLQVLVTALLKGVDDPFRRAKILHDWIALNIAYDAVSFSKNDIPDQSYASVLRSRKAVCDGFSNLYLQMCSLATIKCHKVDGYARAVNFDPFSPEVTSKANHAWNAIFLNGNWYLVDVTWDAGYVNGCYRTAYSFVKRYSTDYFLLEPYYMLHTHFPENSMWQLLEKRASKEDFFALPYLTGDYFDNIEDSDTPLTSINKVGDTASLRLKVKSGRRISAHLVNEKGKATEAATFTTFHDSILEIMIAFPSAGLYSLQLFAGDTKSSSSSSIGDIVYSASSSSKITFPLQFDSSVGNSYKVLSPESGQLKVNKESIFLLSIPNTDSAFLAYNGELLPMLSSAESRFALSLTPSKKGENIMIMIPVKGRAGSYEAILSYAVVD